MHNLFYIFAAIVVISTVFIALTKNVLYAAFALLITFLGISAIYIFAAADFIAVTQIMVYVGGVLVLLIFGVMLTSRNTETQAILANHRNKWLGWCIGLTFGFLLFSTILKTNFAQLSHIQKAALHESSSVQSLGVGLMTDYLLPFELTAILLLIALIGAVVIAAKK